MPYDTTTLIGRMIERTRQITDEPESNAKYTDSQILSYMRSSWETVMQDLLNVADNPIVCRLDISISPSTQVYQLPPNVGEILSAAKIDTNMDLVQWEVPFRSRWNPAGPGFTIEGNLLRASPMFQFSDIIRLTYIPNGDVELHKGETSTHTTTTLTLDSTPTLGTVDNRPNAYAGSVLRVINHGSPTITQERVISAYDASTRIVTVPIAFSPSLSGSAAYEIVPMLANLLEMCVCFHTATLILAIEADAKRLRTVELKYNQMIRGLKLREANIENRIGDRFEHDTVENRNYSGFGYGVWYA